MHGNRADANDFMHGWLNYQIEHHVWPQLSMLSYQKAAPELRAICEKHNVPYLQHNVFKRLKKTADIMVCRYPRPHPSASTLNPQPSTLNPQPSPLRWVPPRCAPSTRAGSTSPMPSSGSEEGRGQMRGNAPGHFSGSEEGTDPKWK